MTNLIGKKLRKVLPTIKFIKFITSKPRVLSVKILWKKGSVLTAASASLPMGHLNLNATLTNRCHIRLDHAMPMQERAIVYMVHDATSYIMMKILKSKPVHCRSLGKYSTKAGKRKEVGFYNS